MKNLVKLLIVSAVLTFATYSVYRANDVYANFTSLQLENIEALTAEGEDMLKCTKPLKGGNCFRGNNFICTYISAVQEYEVPASAPFACDHFQVCPCPSGCRSIPW